MNKSDEYFMASWALLIIAITYSQHSNYFWWFIYLISAVVLTIIGGRIKK
jgi:hypothetical protein